jgi:hypothetical protein
MASNKGTVGGKGTAGGRGTTGGKETTGGQQTEQEILQKATKETECFDYLKRYIKEDKPGLVKFYDNDAKIKDAATKAADLVEKLCDGGKGCTPEVARDMQVLILYDLVMLIDDSTSIHIEDQGKRKTTLVKTLHAIAKIYFKVQKTGIRSVRFLNDNKGRANVRPGNVGPMIKDHTWRGVTRIGTELERKILDCFVYEPKVVPRKLQKREKPLLIMTITDGAIEGEAQKTLQSVIEDCVNHLKKPEADGGFGEHGADTVAFHFSRVGMDEDAAKLLNDLDNDKTIGKYIDCLPVNEQSYLETMISSDRLVKWNILAKLLLGAIIPYWDDYDGGRREVGSVPDLNVADEEDIVDVECDDDDGNDDDDDDDGGEDVQQGGNNRGDDVEDEEAEGEEAGDGEPEDFEEV